MRNVKPFFVGAKVGSSYHGRHRENDVAKGVGYIPLGNRNRVKPNCIHLVGMAEEAESVDRYSRYQTHLSE